MPKRSFVRRLKKLDMLLGAGRGNVEVDSRGWQKLPLHLEVAMMQQSAQGEDGKPPVPPMPV